MQTFQFFFIQKHLKCAKCLFILASSKILFWKEGLIYLETKWKKSGPSFIKCKVKLWRHFKEETTM